MSLYNMLFGQNPLSEVVLEALGVGQDDVPRYRDAYFDKESNRLVIHTRTGGGNRDYYESEARCRDSYPEYFDGDGEAPTGPWNDDMRKLPGFVYDRDDDFDCTYADFFYEIPEAFRPVFDALQDIGAGGDVKPADRWQALLADLKEQRPSDDAVRALAVGERIMGQISARTIHQNSSGSEGGGE